MSTLQRQRNLKLALILASVAITFFVGFIAKMVLLSHH
ncbi:cytochrome oxidase small assembly protein [Aquabacterium sp.]|nr:cytochrome oxidase small assembly protein [Aquabacterium sp.]